MRKSIALVTVAFALIGTSAIQVHGQGNAQPAVERFVLTGLIFLDSASGVAWMQEPNLTGNRAVAVRVGESIGPYRLTKVLEDRVELEGPAGKVLVPLRNEQGSPATAVASAAPSASGLAGPQRAGVVQPAPNAAAAVTPSEIQSLDALRKQYEQSLTEAAKQAERRRSQGVKAEAQRGGARAEPQQTIAAQGDQGPGVQAPRPQPSVTNPSGGTNSNVIMLGLGDPRRKQSFQSMIGVGP